MPLSIRCVHCKTLNELEPPVGRRDECERCAADLRSCVQCVFYDTSSADDCREPSAELVRDKERANFCDFYRAKVDDGESSGGPSKEELRAAAEALFKKK